VEGTRRRAFDLRRPRRHWPVLRTRHEHQRHLTIYLAPWACGREGGLSTGRFEDATEAMAEADRSVVAQLAADDARE